jgi:MFS family permease
VTASWAPDHAPRPRLFTRPFVFCGLANLAQGISFSLFLHVPGFFHRIGASDLEIGLLSGVTGVAAIAARPPIGHVMDTRGRRPVILIGNTLNVLSIGLYAGIEAVGAWLFVVRAVHGLAVAMLFTGLFTYAADCVPAQRRTQGLALFGVSGMLPIALGGLLGDAILDRWDFEQLFLTAAVFAGASWLLALPLRDLPHDHADGEVSRGFRAALSQHDLRPLWWITFVFSIALASVFTFLKRYVATWTRAGWAPWARSSAPTRPRRLRCGSSSAGSRIAWARCACSFRPWPASPPPSACSRWRRVPCR